MHVRIPDNRYWTLLMFEFVFDWKDTELVHGVLYNEYQYKKTFFLGNTRRQYYAKYMLAEEYVFSNPTKSEHYRTMQVNCVILVPPQVQLSLRIWGWEATRFDKLNANYPFSMFFKGTAYSMPNSR